MSTRHGRARRSARSQAPSSATTAGLQISGHLARHNSRPRPESFVGGRQPTLHHQRWCFWTQPTIVVNDVVQSPVEHIVCPCVSRRRGGLQSPNRGRTDMFGPAAPVWEFFAGFGRSGGPIRPRSKRPGVGDLPGAGNHRPWLGRWRTRSDPPDDFRSTTRSVAKRSRSRTGHTYAARRPCGLLQRALVNRRLGPRPRRPKRNPRRGTKTNSTPAFASCRLSTSPRVAMLCSSDAARPATSSFRTQRCCEASSSADAWR